MRLLLLLLFVLGFATSGCRKSATGMRSSFPHPAAIGMTAGTFITTTGTFESAGNPGLPGQTVDFRLSVSKHRNALELDFGYETRRSPRDAEVTRKGEQKTPAGDVGTGWFCFVEKPGTYWIFDGRDSLHLHGHGPHGSPSKSIIQGSHVNRDNPKVPDAVLARLPEKQSQLLSPRSGERPSF